LDKSVRALAAAGACLALAASCGREAAPADSAPLAVEVALSTNVIHVGDPVDVILTVRHPDGAPPEWPEPAATGVVTRSRSVETRRAAAGRAVTRARYTVTSFDVGEHEVFTGAVRAVAAGGGATNAIEAALPRAAFTVESLLVDTNAAPRPLRPPRDWRAPLPRWVWVLPLIALAALAAGLAARRRRGASAPAAAAPPPPAHETALARLAALRAKGWIESGEAEAFYVELSAIIRRYVEGRFGLRAPERTTEEFLREAAESKALGPEQQAAMRAFLESSDLVKFARHRPGAADMGAAIEAAERFVRETAAAPAAAGEAPP